MQGVDISQILHLQKKKMLKCSLLDEMEGTWHKTVSREAVSSVSPEFIKSSGDHAFIPTQQPDSLHPSGPLWMKNNNYLQHSDWFVQRFPFLFIQNFTLFLNL